jgi:hypothetical protein
MVSRRHEFDLSDSDSFTVLGSGNTSKFLRRFARGTQLTCQHNSLAASALVTHACLS